MTTRFSCCESCLKMTTLPASPEHPCVAVAGFRSSQAIGQSLVRDPGLSGPTDAVHAAPEGGGGDPGRGDPGRLGVGVFDLQSCAFLSSLGWVQSQPACLSAGHQDRIGVLGVVRKVQQAGLGLSFEGRAAVELLGDSSHGK